MIKDAGFEIKSDVNLDELLASETEDLTTAGFDQTKATIKELKDLRPVLKQ
jgi:hypothetical protein